LEKLEKNLRKPIVPLFFPVQQVPVDPLENLYPSELHLCCGLSPASSRLLLGS